MKIFAKIVLLAGIILFWIIPIALVPFVSVLPYLFSAGLGERFLFSLVITGVISFCWFLASTEENRGAVIAAANTAKNKGSIVGGILLFSCIPPFLGGNLLGTLVMQFESRPTSMTLQVVGVTERTRKMPRTELVLACARDMKRFYVMLSEARLHVPAVQLNTRVTLHGRTNVFGTYVDRVDLDPLGKVTC